MNSGAVLLITPVSMQKIKLWWIFLRGNRVASKKVVIRSRKVASTSTSTNDASQCRYCNESDMFSTTFVQAEITKENIKELEHQGEFISFKILLQHSYYASNNTNFPE